MITEQPPCGLSLGYDSKLFGEGAIRMLPDFPNEKEQVADVLLDFFKKRMQGYMVPFDKVRRYFHHEGHQHEVVTVDNIATKGGYAEISSSFTISLDRIQEMPPEEVLRELDKSAQNMAGEAKKHAYKTIGEAVERVGNVVSAQGQPLTAEKWLEAFEKIEIDFDEGGEPIMPTMVVGPELGRKLRDLLPQWESDVRVRRHFEDIIERKRLDWRDREARRRLAD